MVLFAERGAMGKEAIFACGTLSLCLKLGTVHCQGVLVKMSGAFPTEVWSGQAPQRQAQRGGEGLMGPGGPSIQVRLRAGGVKAGAAGAQRIPRGDLGGWA